MGTSLDLAPVILKQLRGLQRFMVSPRALLKQIGAIVTKDCRRSFNDQALGDIKWPERYPGQRRPKLNIAGALAEFISGATAPKPNRFADRPALIDEGMRGGLQASITYNVVSDTTVRIGTNKVYAALHQEGGQSEDQTIDTGTQERIRNWLYPQGKGGKPLKKYQKIPMFNQVKMAEIQGFKVPTQKVARSEYAVHLQRFLPEHWKISEFVNSKNGGITYSQQVLPRPFIGVTDHAKAEIDKLIVFHTRKAMGA